MYFHYHFLNSSRATLQEMFGQIPGIKIYARNPGTAFYAVVPFGQTRVFERVLAENPHELWVAYHCRFKQGLDFRNGDRPISIHPSFLGDLFVERWASQSKIAPCLRCAADTGCRDPREIPQLTFLRKPTAHLLSGASLNTYMSEVALDRLTAANLDAGLTALPVHSDGKTSLRWFLLRGQQLSFPDGPFGLWNEMCPVCRSYPPRRYQFGEIYVRPEKPSHWMDFPGGPHDEARMLVSEQVYNWLLGASCDLLAPSAIEYVLYASVCGWYPEDAGYFYLPRHLQAEDTPVLDPSVLPFMTFDTIPVLDSPDLVDPPSRKDALDRGLFRDIYEALDWDQDIVYILDLSGTDTDELYAEDLANFRNLTALILYDTPIQTLPDTIFQLRNLDRIDIRGTRIPPAEVERIRAGLPRWVTLLTD